MIGPAAFLPGAKGRLLPPSIPLRFFAAAVVFQVAAWLVLLVGAGDAVAFEAGLGFPVAAIHLLTLGVLTTTAMGAVFQLLPVATRRPAGSPVAMKLAFWLILPGTLAAAHGMATGALVPLAIGAGLAVGAMVILLWLLVSNLQGAWAIPAVALHGWLAALSLIGLLVLGGLLVADFEFGFLPDHTAVGFAHVVIAGYGFMGMLIFGLSHVLVPMFALAAAPSRTQAFVSAGLCAAALIAAVGGLLADIAVAVVIGIVFGLAAAALHLFGMGQVMAKRMRRKLDLSFCLMAVGWALLPVSLILAFCTVLDWGGPRMGTLFGFVLLAGWLLTFLTAILQRILPFLASMHAAKSHGGPPLLTALGARMPLRLHAVCHLAALALVSVGIAADLTSLVRIGAGFGLVGALAFAAFGLEVTRRVFLRLRAGPGPNRSPERSGNDLETSGAGLI